MMVSMQQGRSMVCSARGDQQVRGGNRQSVSTAAAGEVLRLPPDLLRDREELQLPLQIAQVLETAGKVLPF